MTLIRLGSLIGVGLLVMLLNIAGSVLYMVVYGYLINPGHPKEFYDEHVKVAAPYCSIVAGIPLMFLAGLWVAGWAGTPGALGLRAALVVWLTYAIVDVGVLLAVGMTPKIAGLCAISMATKLAAVCAGALVAVSMAARPVPVG